MKALAADFHSAEAKPPDATVLESPPSFITVGAMPAASSEASTSVTRSAVSSLDGKSKSAKVQKLTSGTPSKNGR